MKSIFNMVGGALLVLVISVWSVSATAQSKLNDLPGGPAVNQLNLQPAATRIAEDQVSLHWVLLIICGVWALHLTGVSAPPPWPALGRHLQAVRMPSLRWWFGGHRPGPLGGDQILVPHRCMGYGKFQNAVEQHSSAA